MGYSSSDSLEHHSNRYCNGHHHHHGHQFCDSMGLASTPKLSSISGAKTETSSMDASMRTSSSPEEVDRSGELSVSISNASDQEREWVEEDEPGVYITIRALPGGIRELRRVRFRFVFCAASLLTHYYLYLNSQCRTRVTYSQQTDEDVLIGWRSEGIPKPSPSEIQLYHYLSLCTRYMITYMILLLQPGEVQRDACQAMVGREPSEDTRTVPLRSPLTIRTA